MIRLPASIFLVLVLSVAGGDSAESQTPSAQGKLYIALLTTGSAWDPQLPANQQKHFREHSASLQLLRNENRLKIGARFHDRGALIIAAADEAEARGLLERDPAIANGVFAMELHEFRPFHRGCLD